MSAPLPTPHGAPYVVICDYNALLQDVTSLLRRSGYAVFQAYNGEAAARLCKYMPEISLLVLNTEGTGVDTPRLVHEVRTIHPGLPVLHIGRHPIPNMPADVVNLPETFGIEELLGVVHGMAPAENRG